LQVAPDGISTRYQGSIFDGIWNKWAVFANLGGTAGVKLLSLLFKAGAGALLFP